MNNKIYLRLVRNFVLKMCKKAHLENPKAFKKDGTLRKGQQISINNDLYARAFNLALRNGYTWSDLTNDYVVRNCWSLI